MVFWKKNNENQGKRPYVMSRPGILQICAGIEIEVWGLYSGQCEDKRLKRKKIEKNPLILLFLRSP